MHRFRGMKNANDISISHRSLKVCEAFKGSKLIFHEVHSNIIIHKNKNIDYYSKFSKSC